MKISIVKTVLYSITFLFVTVVYATALKVPYVRAELVLADSAKTTNNIVTAFAYQSKYGNFLYSGGDGGFFDVYRIGDKGGLNKIGTYELYDSKGPSRGIIAREIGNKEFLFVGNKRGNAIEVFEIAPNGGLTRVHIEHDTDETHLGILITLIVIQMGDDYYLYAGGLEETSGLSAYKILPDGKLKHIQSESDNDVIFTDGVIGMYSHKIDGKTFLVTGGFQDNGISIFEIDHSGHFKNVDNYGDNNTDRFLTGTYPVDGVTLGGEHYIVVGHRHHKYYKRISFIKKKDFVYHGDGVSVFKLDSNGKIIPHFVLRNDETTLLAGQTRIEILEINDNKEAIVAIGTRDDNSIQICRMNGDGLLTPIGSLKTGYPIYYGVASLHLGDDLYFFAGSVDKSLKTIHSYRLRLE